MKVQPARQLPTLRASHIAGLICAALLAYALWTMAPRVTVTSNHARHQPETLSLGVELYVKRGTK